MDPIATFIFIDLETSGLPGREPPKILELSMIATSRKYILNTKRGELPRVLHKLSLCFSPGSVNISSIVNSINGLSNELLDEEKPFDETAVTSFKDFLNRHQKPICLVAHNGDNFDYKILHAEIMRLKKCIANDVMCVDSLKAFRQLLVHYEVDNPLNILTTADDNSSPNTVTIMQMQDVLNESASDSAADISIHLGLSAGDVQSELDTYWDGQSTPENQTQSTVFSSLTLSSQEITQCSPTDKQPSAQHNCTPNLTTSNIMQSAKQPFTNYKLTYIYERLLNKLAIGAHRSENDCMFMLECAIATAPHFIAWCDINQKVFNQIGAKKTQSKSKWIGPKFFS